MNKTILLVEDEMPINDNYKKFFEEKFPGVLITQCYQHKEVVELLEKEVTFDLYILDGAIIGGHTKSFIDVLPQEKVVVISSSADYLNEVEKKGITTIDKPMTRLQLLEALNQRTELFQKILEV